MRRTATPTPPTLIVGDDTYRCGACRHYTAPLDTRCCVCGVTWVQVAGERESRLGAHRRAVQVRPDLPYAGRWWTW